MGPHCPGVPLGLLRSGTCRHLLRLWWPLSSRLAPSAELLFPLETLSGLQAPVVRLTTPPELPAVSSGREGGQHRGGWGETQRGPTLGQEAGQAAGPAPRPGSGVGVLPSVRELEEVSLGGLGVSGTSSPCRGPWALGAAACKAWLPGGRGQAPAQASSVSCLLCGSVPILPALPGSCPSVQPSSPISGCPASPAGRAGVCWGQGQLCQSHKYPSLGASAPSPHPAGASSLPNRQAELHLVTFQESAPTPSRRCQPLSLSSRSLGAPWGLSPHRLGTSLQGAVATVGAWWPSRKPHSPSCQCRDMSTGALAGTPRTRDPGHLGGQEAVGGY